MPLDHLFALYRPEHIFRDNGKKAKFCWILNQDIDKDTSECLYWKYRYEEKMEDLCVCNSLKIIHSRKLYCVCTKLWP